MPLYRPHDRFVGRDRERGAIAGLIEQGRSLITIRGPGGAGKTRLATQVLSETTVLGGTFAVVARYAQDAGELATRLGRVLGVETKSGSDSAVDVETVGNALASRGPVVLLIDDCETAIEAVVSALLVWRELAPEAVFLATSRESLALGGEAVLDLASLVHEDALELLELRADTGGAERTAAEEVAARLDGIPLAIELAAARARVIGMPELLRRLDGSLGALRGKRRDRPVRHATMRAAIEESYNALLEAAREVFCQCSVFVDGFDLRAAEAVLRAASHHPVVDLIEELHACSMLQLTVSDGRRRYSLFPLMQGFAAEHLTDDGASGLRERHAAHYVEVAELAHEIPGPGEADALASLRMEQENLAFARQWLLQHAPAAAVQLTRRWIHAKRLARNIADVRSLAETALPFAEEGSDGFLWLLVEHADASRADHSATAQRRLLEVLPAIEATGDPVLLGRAHLTLARIGVVDSSEVSAHILGARAALRSRAPYFEAQACRSELLWRTRRGRFDEPGDALERLEELGRECESALVRTVVSMARAPEHISRGDYDLAEQCLVIGVTASETVGNSLQIATMWKYRGVGATAAGDLELAIRAWTAARTISEQAGSVYWVAQANHALAELAIYRREWVHASELAAAAMEPTDLDHHPNMRDELNAILGASHAALGRLDDARGCFSLIDQDDDDRPRESVEMQDALRAVLELAEGRNDAAEARLAHLVEPGPDGILRERFVQLRGMAGFLEALLEDGLGTTPERERVLMVGEQGDWFHPPVGDRVLLGRRPRLVAVFQILVDRRRRAVGSPVSIEDVLAGAWPGEKVLPRAGRNRVQVAVSTLRKLGLASVILRDTGGYLLDPDVALEVA